MSGTPNAPEFRLHIDRNPGQPEGAGPKLSSAKIANEQTAAEIRARRAKIHKQHKTAVAEQSVADEAAQMAAQAAPPPPRENIESIEFAAPNGMVIIYGPPSGISLVDRIARLYPGRDTSMAEFRLTRILMGVRSINGVPVPSITDDIGRTMLANRLGDENIDLLMYYDRIHFPPLRQSEIPTIKKNLR